MRPHSQFVNPACVKHPLQFWAHIRTISQRIGYTERPKRKRGANVKKESGPIKVPTLAAVQAALEELGLTTKHILDRSGRPTELGRLIMDYFAYRAEVLHSKVEPRLMNKGQARALFEDLRGKMSPQCPLPMNKQKGEKKAPAYFTGIINMLIEANVEGLPCEYDPRELTTVTRKKVPLRTLARRIDGAFPGPVNPIAVWEVKEYYYTTTFGSRVADGVYETLLDGMELEELREHEKIDVKHYLMVDDRFTWWDCGRSYLCRVIDMLHMGYVDEVLFGTEVMERLPLIVKEWVQLFRERSAGKPRRPKQGS